MDHQKTLTPSAILIALVYLIFGLVLVIWPDTSMLTICRLAGGVMLTGGLASCASYFMQNSYLAWAGRRLSIGLICGILGGFILLRPVVVVDVTPFLIGVLLVFDSANRIQDAVDLRRQGGSRWQLSLTAGIITAVLGVSLMNRPFAAASALTVFIGVCLIIDAFTMMLSGFMMDHINDDKD